MVQRRSLHVESDISGLTFTGTPRVTPLLHTEANPWLGDVSPDGKWIAYESDEAGDRVQIFARPLPDLRAAWAPSTGVGERSASARWDGRERRTRGSSGGP